MEIDWKALLKAHPFLGYSARPGIVLDALLTPERRARILAPGPADADHAWLHVTANAHGFFAPEYPCERGDSDCVIGIFGGSVAQWFALQASQRLCERLKACGRARSPLVLNCAFAGHKQPQACITLLQLLMERQPFDIVVMIDGFNEAALSLYNAARGIWHLFPCSQYMAIVHDEAALIRERPDAEPPSAASVADEWRFGARVASTLCDLAGIAYYHVLQPNQYYSHKVFTDFEREYCLSQTISYRGAVEAVYPSLVEAGKNLVREGIRFADLTTLFDAVPETVYSDNCCHYNARGNELLAERVAEALCGSN